MRILYKYIVVIERFEGVENIVEQNQGDAYREQGTLLNVIIFIFSKNRKRTLFLLFSIFKCDVRCSNWCVFFFFFHSYPSNSFTLVPSSSFFSQNLIIFSYFHFFFPHMFFSHYHHHLIFIYF